MPPPRTGHRLTDKQIDLLRRWIDEGAKWDTHWAFLAPQRTEPPAVSSSASRWVRNPIDRFILARLEREGLKPSPDADPITLLRRVTYDLTGLPPTPEAIDSFLADKSPDAYEKRVDALLQSPRYGERMAMPCWTRPDTRTRTATISTTCVAVALARWVITAFNRNLPFDQFTIEQPRVTSAERDAEQKVASGFNRTHMITSRRGDRENTRWST